MEVRYCFLGAICLVILTMVAYWSELQSNVITNMLQRLTCNDEYSVSISRRVKCSGDREVCQYGDIKAGRKYAVFTSSLFDGAQSMNYAFGLPFAAVTWRRIGYDSIVMLVGDPSSCGNNTRVQIILESLLSLDYVVVLVLQGIPQSQSVTISQVSRLFVTSLIQDGGDPVTWENTYLVTADADIWPIAHGFFDLPDGKDILHGDIGPINVGGTRVTHAPLSYVGMTTKTWISVMTKSGENSMPTTPAEVIKHLTSIFGNSCCNNVTHGGPGWGMDQQLVSLRVHQWKTAHQTRTNRVYVYKRNFAVDRYDRPRWQHMTHVEGIVDSHILKYSYRPEVWTKLRPLLALLTPDADTLSWADKFSKSFYDARHVC